MKRRTRRPACLAAVLAGALAALACGMPSRSEPAAAEPASLVDWVWSGAVTADGATIKARVPGVRPVRLVGSPQEDLSAPIVSAPQLPSLALDHVVTVRLSDLRPATVYHYGFTAGDAVDHAHRGRFRTFPAGPASFTVAYGSCAQTGSSHAVWDVIREADPLLFLHMGDFHYEDVASRRRAPYRRAFAASLAAPRQARLYRAVPIAYVWDDHDFGGNTADARSPGRHAVRLVYQEIVPHYPLAAGSGDVPIYQSFAIGRLRFVITDLRSERAPPGAPDGPAKTVMGAPQKAWWREQMLAARAAGQLVVWVSTIPWIGDARSSRDGWGHYAGERRELAAFLAAQGLDGRLVMLSGDAHMVAIDDGTHNRYAPGGGPGFPVMHAAALDRSGSVKGGPYSEGTFPNPLRSGLQAGQFGLMTVRDTGGAEVCIDWSGRRVEPTGAVSELVRWGRCFAVGSPLAPSVPQL